MSQLVSRVEGKGANISTLFRLSDHARRRMSQRGIREDQVHYVIQHGKTYNRAGAKWFTLRLKDIPAADRSNDRIAKADGIVVCTAGDEIVTVYHNVRPSIHLRRKRKYDDTARSDVSCERAA